MSSGVASVFSARHQTPDAEFVLGAHPIEAHYPTPKTAEFERWGGTSTTVPNREAGQAVILRLLDFNQCRRISMDKVGVGEAVDGFCVNDPKYPHSQVDEQLWVTLRDTYLSASAEIV